MANLENEINPQDAGINPDNGVVILDKPFLRIGPELTLSEFLAADWAKGATDCGVDAGRHRWSLAGEYLFMSVQSAVSLFFEAERLACIVLNFCMEIGAAPDFLGIGEQRSFAWGKIGIGGDCPQEQVWITLHYSPAPNGGPVTAGQQAKTPISTTAKDAASSTATPAAELPSKPTGRDSPQAQSDLDFDPNEGVVIFKQPSVRIGPTLTFSEFLAADWAKGAWERADKGERSWFLPGEFQVTSGHCDLMLTFVHERLAQINLFNRDWHYDGSGSVIAIGDGSFAWGRITIKWGGHLDGEIITIEYDAAAQSFRSYRKAAEQGDAIAQYDLGRSYYNGTGVGKDQREAVKWFRRAAEQGNVESQFLLGACYERGMGVEQNLVEAVNWYRQAAEHGHADAQYNLGACYANAKGVKKDQNEAVKWHRKAAEQGDARSQCWLGVCYELGTGVEQNEVEAVNWYRKAAEQDHADAQFNLGVCCANARGVKKNQYEAARWYRMAAAHGDARGQFWLGVCHELGTGVNKSEVEAVTLFRKAAEQGHADAQAKLGDCFQNGIGIKQNLIEAVKWYRKGAEQGLAVAQYDLGRCYYNGTGVAKDQSAAVKWFRKAAEQGNAQSQCILGSCCERGTGVEQNQVDAVKWFRMAAEQGHAEAQCNLGACYANAMGVKKDQGEAVNWYRKAAAQGDARGQFWLGVCYELGTGVEQNHVDAVTWFRKAAEQDHAGAQANLGICLQYGIGVDQSLVEAVRWYRKGADQGLAVAQYNLGACCQYGNGVEQDLDRAITLYRKAAEQGDVNALAALEKMGLRPQSQGDGPTVAMPMGDGVGPVTAGLPSAQGKMFGFLIAGKRYHVIRQFVAFEKSIQALGEKWIFLGCEFHPNDNGYSFLVSPDGLSRREFRLSTSVEQEAEILAHLDSYVSEIVTATIATENSSSAIAGQGSELHRKAAVGAIMKSVTEWITAQSYRKAVVGAIVKSVTDWIKGDAEASPATVAGSFESYDVAEAGASVKPVSDRITAPSSTIDAAALGDIPNHAGEPRDPKFDFFTAPPAELGQIISMQSTLKTGSRPLPWALRVFTPIVLRINSPVSFFVALVAVLILTLICGCIPVLLDYVLGGMRGVLTTVDELCLSFGFIFLSIFCVINPFIFVIVYFVVKRCYARNTFVCSGGLFDSRLSGGRGSRTIDKVMLFSNAAALQAWRPANCANGGNPSMRYSYTWRGRDGVGLFKLAGRAYPGKPGDPWHFADAAERAWTVHYLRYPTIANARVFAIALDRQVGSPLQLQSGGSKPTRPADGQASRPRRIDRLITAFFAVLFILFGIWFNFFMLLRVAAKGYGTPTIAVVDGTHETNTYRYGSSYSIDYHYSLGRQTYNDSQEVTRHDYSTAEPGQQIDARAMQFGGWTMCVVRVPNDNWMVMWFAAGLLCVDIVGIAAAVVVFRWLRSAAHRGKSSVVRP